MRLDHFVVHITKNEGKLELLKSELAELGIPFDPKRGKGTKGFKVANVWIGEQYLELPWILTKDGGGWRADWVSKYHEGKRGIFGLCLMVDDIEQIKRDLENRGVQVEGPERITFKILGLFKKSLPFQTLYTPNIPGTDLQIMFLQMDSQKMFDYTKKHFMHPNSEKNGVTGIGRAVVELPESPEVRELILKVFPSCKVEDDKMTFEMKDTTLEFQFNQKQELKVHLYATTTNPNYPTDKRIEIENITLQLV